MKTYEKNGLKYAYLLDKNGKDAILFVTADSIYQKLGYKPENKSRWIKENLLDKYSDNTYVNNFTLGYCIDVQIAEDLLYTIKSKYRQKCKALADIISIEEDDFYMNDRWKKEGFGEGEDTFYTTKNWVEEVNEYDEQFYKENIQPKVTEALENIQPKKIAAVDFKLFELPDSLTINGKEYVSKESVEKDFVEASMKLEAMKNLLAG